MALFSQMAHCIVCYTRLAIFEYPGWDLQTVQSSCDLSDILRKLIKRFSQVKAVTGIDTDSPYDGDNFTMSVRKLSAIKHWWDAKNAAHSADVKAPPEPAIDGLLAEASKDFLDDAWLWESLMPLDDIQPDQTMQ